MDYNKIFSNECIWALNEAYKWSKKKKHEYVTVDTFMMFLSQTDKGKEIFSAMNLDVSHFVNSVGKYLDEHIPKLISGENPELTIQLKELKDHAVLLHKASGKQNQIDESYILVALFELNADESFTLTYFDNFEVSRFDIMSYIAHNKKKVKEEDKPKEMTKNALQKFAINLNKRAKEGKIDAVIGREKEIKKAIEILAQRRKNNPLLVGEPGVGKTAIAEGLAKEIVEGNVPSQLANFQIYSLDMPSVLAGTKYRGDFEERLKHIIKEASEDPNIVLFIDEIHNIIGAGSGNGTMDASNILKPALTSGLKVIGATTYDEYRKYFEKEGALARRFQKIDIEEPSQLETLEILKGLKKYYETFHAVTYTDSALEETVSLSHKYITDKKFPDKALDIIDIAGSQVKLFESSKKIVDVEKIKEVISSVARVPIQTMKENEKDKLKNLDNHLKGQIFGQNQAIDKVVDAILFSRAQLNPREKPIGSFLFAGSSGVGKTELAKQLSLNLGIPFVRFDMSEYMEKHAVAKLIGAPPGYVGYDQGGQLIEAIKKNPHCVLLLDEIEKAHSDIYNILLQIMDYATLSDNNGKKANFKNIVLIMTTNLGGKEIHQTKIGFNKHQDLEGNRETIIKNSFSPEFYNRLDAVIQFNSLNQENIVQIVQKNIQKLQNHLLDKKIVSIFTPEVLDFIAKNGFDEKLGARPLERYIEKNISQVLAKEILFGQLEEGGEIKVDIVNNEIKIEYLHCYIHDVDKKPKPRRKKKEINS